MGITFFDRLSPDVPPILSDLSQLQQVFLDLITNAIDAHETKPYGSVSVSSAFLANDGAVEVAVSDTGCGIPPENLTRIFDPFFTTKPLGKGTGLGLSICCSIIKRLGGQIQVHSTIDQGTDFILRLPLRCPEVQHGAGHHEPYAERAA